MAKGFDSEKLKRMAIETISAEDSNYNRVFEHIWSQIDQLFADNVDNSVKKDKLNTILKLYAQMIVMESVNMTLNALVDTGTLVSPEDN